MLLICYNISTNRKRGFGNMNIWKQESDFNQELYNNMDRFYEQLQGQKHIEYRPGQDTMSYDILDILNNKEVLVIEAGVGIGKSWAYLIPLIYASQDKDKFKGFLISTSSIALQEQLQKEVARVSKMLGIDIDVTVAKGKNNYICKKRLEQFLKYGDKKHQYQYLKDIFKDGIVDKKDYNVPQYVWKRINVDNVSCTNCLYKYDCQYKVTRKQWKQATNIICNHDLLVEILKRDSQDKLVQDPSILIVDEAHTLIEKIINSYKRSISKTAFESLIYNIYNRIDESVEDNLPVIDLMNAVFRMISTKAKKEYRAQAREEKEVLDSESSGFTCTPMMKQKVMELVVQLTELENYVKQYPSSDKKLIGQVSSLKEIRLVFSDLISSFSKNIYWVNFLPNTKEHIELNYVPKNVSELARKLLSNPNYGKVFTSATLTTGKNDYSYFMKGLGLDQMIGMPVFQEFSQPSPYNYDENTLLYCATDVVNPKSKDHSLYLDSLASKVDELINITDGRSLVLFTSKQDMREVYDRLMQRKHDFNILVQEDGINAERLKMDFKQDVTSTLLATGAFWEGIDIKGESLEQVIIAKLPFPVVEPVVEERASHYTDGFKEVYLPEMLLKLKQGAGRLIRSSTDKGIVSILDSRINDYGKYVLSALPFNIVTGSIDDVDAFSRGVLRHDSLEQVQNNEVVKKKI